MTGILARLGQVILLVGALLTLIAQLIIFGFFVWQVWTDANLLWTSAVSGDWRALGTWILAIALVLGIPFLLAFIPMLIGVACCYVLGGFSDQQRPNSN